MCNLYRLRTAKAEISQIFGVEVPAGANFGEEVVKGYPGLMITGGRAQSMNWGFPRVLRGKQGQKLAPTAVNNARSDNLASPFWQSSFETRRCLIPVSQWAEPQGEDRRMTRTWYALPGDMPFAVGGIWRPTDMWGNCYSMVMVPASPQMQEVHDRMPVILPREDWDRWLGGSATQAFDLCRTWEDRLEVERTQDRWVDGQPLLEDEPPKLQDLPLFKDL